VANMNTQHLKKRTMGKKKGLFQWEKGVGTIAGREGGIPREASGTEAKKTWCNLLRGGGENAITRWTCVPRIHVEENYRDG